MSVAVTTLKSGINVVTDTMPHLETASLGVWVNTGSRGERHDEHGISHSSSTWRSRARGGEARGRSPRRSRPSAAISTPPPRREHRLLRARAQGRRAARARRPGRHSLRTGLRPRRTRREQNVIVQEIGAVADTPDDLCSSICRPSRFLTSRSAARYSEPRRPCVIRRANCATTSPGIIAALILWSRPLARSIKRPLNRRGGSTSRASTDPPANFAKSGASMAAAAACRGARA